VDPAVVAAKTPGFVGSDLPNIVNEAALLARVREKKPSRLAILTKPSSG